MVGKRRRCSARTWRRAVERDWTEGGASRGAGVDRPLWNGVELAMGEPRRQERMGSKKRKERGDDYTTISPRQGRWSRGGAAIGG